MTQFLWILGILFVTILLALILQILERFPLRMYIKEGFEQYTTDPNTYHQTGYVNGEFRPSSGSVPSQLENVPTLRDVLLGKIQRDIDEIPIHVVAQSLNIDNPSHTDTILQTFVKDTQSTNVPDIILNPNSRQDKQVTCRLGETCDADVVLGNLYCPVGMRKVETGDPANPYSGCYSGGNNVIALACRFAPNSTIPCSLLRQKKIQRVGNGFQMFPPVSAYQQLVTRYQAEGNTEAINHISNSWHSKYWLSVYMAMSYKQHMQAYTQTRDQNALNLIWQFITNVFTYGTLLYQPQVEDMSRPRIGVVLPNHISISNIQTEQYPFDYNITNISNIHDTTMEPLPLLREPYQS